MPIKQYVTVVERTPDPDDAESVIESDLVTIILENGAKVNGFAAAKELGLAVLDKAGLIADENIRVKLNTEESEDDA